MFDPNQQQSQQISPDDLAPGMQDALQQQLSQPQSKDLQSQSQNSQPPPQNNAQNAGPVKAGLRHVLAQMIGNFSYGAGQSMIKASGGETDAERSMRIATLAHLNAQTQMVQQQSQMMKTTVPVTLPNGSIIHLPPKLAEDYLKNQATVQGRLGVAGINEDKGLGVARINQGIDPDTGEPLGGRTLGDYGATGNLASLPVSRQSIAAWNAAQRAAGRTTTHQQVIQTPDGPMTLNLSSTSKPNAISSAPGKVGGGQARGGNTARPILDKTGNPLPPTPAQASGDAKWVTWEENGRTVAGPRSLARQNGAQNPAEVPAQGIRDITNARHAVNLMTKQGDPSKPETQGVLQLIDSLDKDGKLGVLSSRWNSFMTNGVGASPGDDPRIITLINKNMLSDTATMLSHFGASGGRSPQMLQHFLDLANSRKMDGPTLRAGVMAMADYMKDRAMVPGSTGGGRATHKWNPSTGRIDPIAK